MRTIKSDWLNDYLAHTGNILVSGHKCTSDFLGLPDSAIATFRFAGNRQAPALAFLTIELDPALWESTFSLLCTDSTSLFKAVAEIKSYLSLEMPCILYSKNANDKFGYFNGTAMTLNSSLLQSEIGRLNDRLVLNGGSVLKEINKSSNDHFQTWGRENLSRYYVVNDFDAFTFPSSGMRVMYELKRIQEDIATWRPYLDDSANYAALATLCGNAQIKLRVIAYQEARQDLVSVHHIAAASADEITGSMLICPPGHITGIQIGEKYSSTRRRVPRS